MYEIIMFKYRIYTKTTYSYIIFTSNLKFNKNNKAKKYIYLNFFIYLILKLNYSKLVYFTFYLISYCIIQ